MFESIPDQAGSSCGQLKPCSDADAPDLVVLRREYVRQKTKFANKDNTISLAKRVNVEIRLSVDRNDQKLRDSNVLAETRRGSRLDAGTQVASAMAMPIGRDRGGAAIRSTVVSTSADAAAARPAKACRTTGSAP